MSAPSSPPPGYREALQALRQARPGEGFGRRLEASLDRVDAQAARPQRAQPPVRFMSALGALSLLIAGVTTVGLIDSAEEQGAFVYAQEVDLEHPGEELVWLELDLTTHHHGEHEATLHIEVPPEMSVRYDGESPLATCGPTACVHRVTQRSQPGLALVQVGVPRPGLWPVRVEHRSPDAHVNESITVRARP